VYTAPPLDASGVAGITAATPLGSAALFATELFGLDLDVNVENISVFGPGSAPVPSIPIAGLSALDC
jgi:hypothetical protein